MYHKVQTEHVLITAEVSVEWDGSRPSGVEEVYIMSMAFYSSLSETYIEANLKEQSDEALEDAKQIVINDFLANITEQEILDFYKDALAEEAY